MLNLYLLDFLVPTTDVFVCAMNLTRLKRNQVLIKLLISIMKLNVFYVPFVILPVLVSVTTTNASSTYINKKQEMYQTYVMICLNGEKPDSINCEQLADVRGPYKTEEECINRAIEIRDNLPLYKEAYYAVGYHCELKTINKIEKEGKT